MNGCSRFFAALYIAAIFASCAARAGQTALPENIFDVPMLDGTSAASLRDDLNRNGLQINTMCCAKGFPWPLSTAAPSMRIGWTASGLAISVTVHHPHPWEADYVRHLFKGDSVEFFVSPHKGSRDRYMLIVSPGLDPRYPEPRHCFFADPSEELEKDLSDLTFQITRKKTDDGYEIEVILPWSNLHIEPNLGMELALQVYVMEAEPNAMPSVAMWHPGGESYVDPSTTQRIRLTEKASAPALVCAIAQDDTEHDDRSVRIVAPQNYAGRRFEIHSLNSGVVFGNLLPRLTQSFATVSVPIGEDCQVFVDGASVPLSIVQTADNLATVLSQKLKCKFQSSLFTPEKFPYPYVEGAQHFRIAAVSYYDAQHQRVDEASQPGRYGAVIDVADQYGRTTRRYRSLFRLPQILGPWSASDGQLKSLPSLLLRDRHSMQCVQPDASGQPSLAFLAQPDALADPDTAALMACFLDKENGAAACDFREVDRQWWVDQKRQLNGWDRLFPTPFTCPMPLSGTPAPVVHQDTIEKAGVSTIGVQQIDQICKEIVGDVGEPVSICLVRHGVVFFHHAYGKIGGRPFAVDDAGDIMSATKPLAGALMMELMNARSIELDEPIDKIFPSFRGIRVKRSMTIRDLYDHLNGLSGDWGDAIHDTEEIIAGYYSTVDVGNYSYNEVGFALGGKILEAVSGEAFPQFARRHLLDPLGMDHTRVTNAGGHNATTSLDYAKFGQMLLNRGSYGNMRFFSEKTFNDMLPATDGSNRRGIGLTWMNWQRYGFASGTFGHNAGNSSVLAVDPDHDLVVVIVGSGARKDFESRATPFYEAVIHALVP